MLLLICCVFTLGVATGHYKYPPFQVIIKAKNYLISSKKNKSIDKFYSNLISKYKVIGGKLIGAGGGGFILVCTKDKKDLCKKLNDNKIDYINFNLEQDGSKIINS